MAMFGQDIEMSVNDELEEHLDVDHGLQWDMSHYTLSGLQYEHLRAHVRDRKAGITVEDHTGDAYAFPEGKSP